LNTPQDPIVERRLQRLVSKFQNLNEDVLMGIVLAQIERREKPRNEMRAAIGDNDQKNALEREEPTGIRAWIGCRPAPAMWP